MDVGGVLDAAAHAHDHLRRSQVHGLRRAAETLAGTGTNLRRLDGGREGGDRGCAGLSLVGTEGSGLHRNKAGAVAGVTVRAIDAALHELTREDGAFSEAGHVADEHLVEAGGEFGSVVADLVSVREKDEIRLLRLEKLLQSQRKSVRCVCSQLWVLDTDDFGERFGGYFGGQGFGLRAEDDGVYGLAGERG
jgi:hypothetical protein